MTRRREKIFKSKRRNAPGNIVGMHWEMHWEIDSGNAQGNSTIVPRKEFFLHSIKNVISSNSVNHSS